MRLKFDSRIHIGANFGEFTEEQIKNEPMLFNCDLVFSHHHGGPITKAFIEALPEDWRTCGGQVFDSRVHMLMKGWFPAIPGMHHDDVPRNREDGQPDYFTTRYHAEHCLGLVGDCCPTQFAIGTAEFEDVELGQKYYEVWHPQVEEMMKTSRLNRIDAPSSHLVFFDWQTWHQGIKSVKNGWRWFGRISRNTDRKPSNEIRRQVNVYLDAALEGW